MAKSLKTLIRLHEWIVDERQRALGEIMRALRGFEDGLTALEEEVVSEQRSAASTPGEAGLFYGNYAMAVINRREELHQEIANVEQQISVARDHLNEAYRELKKYEIVEDQRVKRVTAEANRKEQMVLDELGAQTHQGRRL